MLDGLCSLLAAQDFGPGVVKKLPKFPGVYASNAPQGAPRPHLLVRRGGGNRNATFDHNDGSLVSTAVDLLARDTDAIRAANTADLVIAFLENCWPVEITCANGNREITFVECEQPTDDAQAPQDASGDWDIGSQFSATIQHATPE